MTANPPYQPDFEAKPGCNWWGAEQRGEAVWRPMVQQLHGHLKPGGRCFIILQGLSWAGDPFVGRVGRYAPTLQIAFDRFGSADLADYRRRYAGHDALTANLRGADYGVLCLQDRAPVSASEAS